MKDQLLKPSYKKFTGSILRSPWKRIPAVSKVVVETKDYNTILESIGIRHKLPATLIFERNPNHKLNRYIGHQIIRMRKAKEGGKYELFWTIANACLRSSVSFRLSAINHVKPNWWFGLSAGRIHQINRGVNWIFKDLPASIKFRRVYIPKPGQKWRPLGVPADEWRIALHMLNNMLVLWFQNDMLPSQHGYIPGLGCKTAWARVVKQTLKAKWIYETDLKGFFDNVSVFEIYDHLRRGNVPQKLVSWIYNLCKSVPDLPKVQHLKEERYDVIDAKTKVTLPYDIVEYLVETKSKLLSANLSAQTMNYLVEILSRKGVSIDEYLPQKNKMDKQPGGVPQGSPLSPFLAILAIRPYLSQQKCVNYADDQIFYSDEYFEIKDDPANGIIHNQDKSGWIRKNGVWQKELKFLGLIYNPWKDTLRSETRAGRSARIEDSLIELWEDLEYDKDEKYLEKMVTKNFFGFVMSCLYNGSWKASDFATKERLVNKNSFLGKYVNSPTLSSAVLRVLGGKLKLKNVRKLT